MPLMPLGKELQAPPHHHGKSNPFGVGHGRRPQQPIAARGEDVEGFGLDDAARDDGRHHLECRGRGGQEEGYHAPRYVLCDTHLWITEPSSPPPFEGEESSQEDAGCACTAMRVMCDMHICHERKIGRLFSKFEIVASEPSDWDAREKCCDQMGTIFPSLKTTVSVAVAVRG